MEIRNALERHGLKEPCERWQWEPLPHFALVWKDHPAMPADAAEIFRAAQNDDAADLPALWTEFKDAEAAVEAAHDDEGRYAGACRRPTRGDGGARRRVGRRASLTKKQEITLENVRRAVAEIGYDLVPAAGDPVQVVPSDAVTAVMRALGYTTIRNAGVRTDIARALRMLMMEIRAGKR